MLGKQRINLNTVIAAGTQAAESCDDEVVPGGMVVIAAALLVAFQPVACRLVKVFTDVGLTAHVLALHVFL